MTRVRARVLPVVLLLGLGVALFPRILRGEVFYDRDLHLEWYAQMEGFVRAVAAGGWPVWDNSIAFGQPLLADPSAQILYPSTWLNLVALPWTYYTLYVVFHLGFAGYGLFRLARALGVSQAGALTAAGVWTASGPLVSLVNVWHHFAGAAWIPWVVLAAHAAFRSGRSRDALLLGVALSLQILAGSADMCAMTGLCVAGLALMRAQWRRPAAPENRRLLGTAALASLLAATLTAAAWLPALEIVSRSARLDLPEGMRTLWSVSFAGLAQVAWPVFLKDLPLLPALRGQLFDGPEPFLASLYLGSAAGGLVAAAASSSRRRRVTAVALLGAAALLVALGRHAPFYAVAVALVPPLRMLRYPMKAMILVAFAWSLLAGFGFDGWREGAGGRSRRLGVALVSGGLGLVGGAVVLAALGGVAGLGRLVLEPAARPMAAVLLRDPLLHVAAGALAGLGVAALALAGAGGSGARLAPLAGALAVVDLYAAHAGLIPTAPRALLAFRPPAVEALGKPDRSRIYVYEYFLTPGSSRRYLGREDPYVIGVRPRGIPFQRLQVLSQRLYPFPPVAGRWGFEGSFDVDTRGLYSRETSQLQTLLRSVEGTRAHTRLLQVGAVRFVLALHEQGFEDLERLPTLTSLFPEPIRIFRVPDPLPRTYAVGGVRVAQGPEALATLLDPGFDPRAEIVLPSGSPRASDAFRGESRIARFAPDRVRLEASLSAPGYVVLVDAYDPGWRASVDGRPAPVLRANVAFRAVPVGAGRHQVELAYRPPAVIIGLALSGLGLLAAAILGARLGPGP